MTPFGQSVVVILDEAATSFPVARPRAIDRGALTSKFGQLAIAISRPSTEFVEAAGNVPFDESHGSRQTAPTALKSTPQPEPPPGMSDRSTRTP